VAGKWSSLGERLNIGILLGASGLAVVEPDTDAARARLLELLGGELPQVPIVESGGRSLHLYFADAGYANGARDGLELRSGLQQVVAPPSVHPETGRLYRWLPGHEPWTLPLSEIPEPLLAHFAEKQGGRRGPVDEEIHQGERRRALLSLAGSMRRRGMGAREMLAALRIVNEERCKPPLPAAELEDLAADVARRYEPESPDPEQERLREQARMILDEHHAPRQRSRAKRQRPELFLPFVDVQLSGPPRWLWRGRVPEGAVTLVAGRPKLGKSLFAVWLAAQLSRGLLEGAYSELPAKTLIVAAEDPPDPIVKGRLIAAAADQALVGTLVTKSVQGRQDRHESPRTNGGGLGGLDGAGAYARRLTIPDEYRLLEQIVVENEIALVVLDPINSFITKSVDAHRDAEIRRVLDPLGAMAARRGFAALCVVHLNRRSDTDILNRITGSGGYGGSARSILTFGRHPEDDAQRVIAAEGNWQKESQSDLFELREVIVFADAEPDEQTQPALVRVGGCDLESGDLIGDLVDDRGTLEEAKDYLLGELVGGPVPVNDLRRGAEANGISWRTVERAKKLLGVEARRISSAGTPRGSGRWEWFLELKEQKPAE
jgi:hypothetical protein